MKAPERIFMPDQVWQAMLDHVQQCLPNEACGLLAGEGESVVEVLPVENVDQSRVTFRMDPEQQVKAMFRIEDSGLSVVGIFHSHPEGPSWPSDRDLAEAAYPEAAYLIWEPVAGDWVCRAFVLVGGGVHEISIHRIR